MELRPSGKRHTSLSSGSSQAVTVCDHLTFVYVHVSIRHGSPNHLASSWNTQLSEIRNKSTALLLLYDLALPCLDGDAHSSQI